MLTTAEPQKNLPWSLQYLCLCLVAAAFASATAADAQKTIVLVRHAEKETGSNPQLTAAGQARAESLARVLADKMPSVIVSTNTCRTLLTAQPVALAAALPISVQPLGPGNGECKDELTARVRELPDGTADFEELARELPDLLSPGETALVVGHSNTTPALLESLGAKSICPDLYEATERGCSIDESEYSHLFVVQIAADGSVTSLRTRYGAP